MQERGVAVYRYVTVYRCVVGQNREVQREGMQLLRKDVWIEESYVDEMYSCVERAVEERDVWEYRERYVEESLVEQRCVTVQREQERKERSLRIIK